MTKTTSYEISKKLKEAGFDAETDYNFIERNNQKAFLVNIKELSSIEIMNEIGVFIKAYDLETIIDALPIKIGGYGYFSIGCRKNSPFMPFSVGYNLESDKCYDTEIFIDKIKNESLADTAGKMWLLLKEKGLIC